MNESESVVAESKTAVKRKRTSLTEAQKARNRERKAKWLSNYENKERMKVQQMEYYAKPEIKARQREHLAKWHARPESKAKQRESQAKWYAKPENKARHKETKARYRARPEIKEKRRLESSKFRAKKLSATIGDLSVITKWEHAWRRSKRVRCYWCSGEFSGKSCHADHIQPLSKSGTHSIENLCVSCAPCNQRKSAKDLDAWNSEISRPVLL